MDRMWKETSKWYGSSNGVHYFPRREELMCHPNLEGASSWFYGVNPIGGYDQRGPIGEFLT